MTTAVGRAKAGKGIRLKDNRKDKSKGNPIPAKGFSGNSSSSSAGGQPNQPNGANSSRIHNSVLFRRMDIYAALVRHFGRRDTALYLESLPHARRAWSQMDDEFELWN